MEKKYQEVFHYSLATEFNIKSLNLLLYYAGGTQETSLLRKVLLRRYYIFLRI